MHRWSVSCDVDVDSRYKQSGSCVAAHREKQTLVLCSRDVVRLTDETFDFYLFRESRDIILFSEIQPRPQQSITKHSHASRTILVGSIESTGISTPHSARQDDIQANSVWSLISQRWVRRIWPKHGPKDWRSCIFTTQPFMDSFFDTVASRNPLWKH